MKEISRIRGLLRRKRLLTKRESQRLLVLHFATNPENTIESIANHVGMSIDGVRWCLERFWEAGVDRAVFHKSGVIDLERRDKVSKMIKKGWSLRRMAMKLNVSPSALCQAFRRIPHLRESFETTQKNK